MNTLEYFSGQGKILLGKRQANGMPGVLRWVGDALMEFGFTPSKEEFKENWSGQRSTGLSITGETTGSLDITFLQLNYPNLQIITRGEKKAQSTTAVTGRVIGTAPLAVGDILLLNAFNVSAVTIKDSTATPKVLAADEDYRLDPLSGQVEILDVTTNGPFTGDIKADFTPGAADLIKMMSAAEEEYWVRFIGVNTVAGALYKNVMVDFYRWQPPPSESLSLINDSRLESPVSGSVLMDPTKSANDDFGYFGRMIMLPDAA